MSYVTLGELRAYLNIKDTDTYTPTFAADTLTLSDVAFRNTLKTGTEVTVDSTLDDPPDPLVEGTVYYVIAGADQVIQLATTSANATAGTEITLTDDGTGTHSITREDADTAILTRAINASETYIDGQTNRHFEAETATKYYERSALSRWDSRLLDLLKDDLLTITTLTNGDSSATVIAAANYWLVPRNEGPPYHGILLKTDISDYWQWDTDGWVSIAGTWGYSATPPGDVQQETLELAAFLYRRKDSQIWDTTAIPEAGVITIPAGIPATVTRMIERYKVYL